MTAVTSGYNNIPMRKMSFWLSFVWSLTSHVVQKNRQLVTDGSLWLGLTFEFDKKPGILSWIYDHSWDMMMLDSSPLQICWFPMLLELFELGIDFVERVLHDSFVQILLHAPIEHLLGECGISILGENVYLPTHSLVPQKAYSPNPNKTSKYQTWNHKAQQKYPWNCTWVQGWRRCFWLHSSLKVVPTPRFLKNNFHFSEHTKWISDSHSCSHYFSHVLAVFCHLLTAKILPTAITDWPDWFASQHGILWHSSVWNFHEHVNHILLLHTFWGRDIYWLHAVLRGQFSIKTFFELNVFAFSFMVNLANSRFSRWVAYRYTCLLSSPMCLREGHSLNCCASCWLLQQIWPFTHAIFRLLVQAAGEILQTSFAPCITGSCYVVFFDAQKKIPRK